MHRRSFLVSGLGTVAGATLLAGCLQQSGDGNQSEDHESGLAPEPREVPAPEADPSSFDRLEIEGTAVPLVPIDVAHPWYLRQEARFVDARTMTAYESAHISGAAFSPAPSGYESDDPTEDWSASERIVTYCGCPHTLSSQRAAALIDAGYEKVYALDEGFWEWTDKDYPVASSSGAVTLARQREITGRVDASYAGELVNLRHEPTGQREPGEIATDGSFTVTFHFVEIEDDSALVLETPNWTQTGTVAELTSGTVR